MTGEQTVTVRIDNQDMVVTLEQILQEISIAALDVATRGRKPIQLSDAKRYLRAVANKYTEGVQRYSLIMRTAVLIPVGSGDYEYSGPLLPQSWYNRFDAFYEDFGKAVSNFGQQKTDAEQFITEVKQIAVNFGCTVK